MWLLNCNTIEFLKTTNELPGDKDNNFLSPRRFYTEEDRYLDEKWLQGATKLNIIEAPKQRYSKATWFDDTCSDWIWRDLLWFDLMIPILIGFDDTCSDLIWFDETCSGSLATFAAAATLPIPPGSWITKWTNANNSLKNWTLLYTVYLAVKRRYSLLAFTVVLHITAI